MSAPTDPVKDERSKEKVDDKAIDRGDVVAEESTTDDDNSQEDRGEERCPEAVSERVDAGEVQPHRLSRRLVSAASEQLLMSLEENREEEGRKGRHSPWSRNRIRTNILGCFCSCVVLTVRLYLDIRPTAYLIHSIVVFFDMILIHLFTNSRWLSASGELSTVVFFLAFHFTKETVFELMETTLIAILCSFHLIASRNKHIKNEEALEHNMQSLRRETLVILNNLNDLQHDDDDTEPGDVEADIEATTINSAPLTTMTNERIDLFTSDREVCRRRLIGCGLGFYEHFLDGSAGVMYTSFLGLIIDELIRYGQGEK